MTTCGQEDTGQPGGDDTWNGTCDAVYLDSYQSKSLLILRGDKPYAT